MPSLTADDLASGGACASVDSSDRVGCCAPGADDGITASSSDTNVCLLTSASLANWTTRASFFMTASAATDLNHIKPSRITTHVDKQDSTCHYPLVHRSHRRPIAMDRLASMPASAARTSAYPTQSLGRKDNDARQARHACRCRGTTFERE